MFLSVNLMVSVMAQTPLPIDQAMLNDATELSTALGVPLTSSSQIWTESLFPVGGSISTNSLQFIKQDSLFAKSVDFVVSSNGNTIAYGELYERTSYEEARVALMLELVNCSMAVEDLAQWIYRLYATGIGDFCVIKTKHDAVTGNRADIPSVIHFVRGAKAVSLFGKDDADVRAIARTLDGILKR